MDATSKLTFLAAADLIRTKRQETDEEFDQRYIDFFNRKDIDGWEIRRAFGNLAGEFNSSDDPKFSSRMLSWFE